jgi:two-component system response regulator YesN
MYHILIVDDEPLICKGLSNLLLHSEMDIARIQIAHSGAEALDYLRMDEIDLLITDIQMGAISGIDLMHQAKMITPRIQTIVISAHDTFQYAQQAMRLGAKDYLVKPINNGQLLDSVRNVLLKMDKSSPVDNAYLVRLKENFMMEEPRSELSDLLYQFINREQPFSSGLALRLLGPYYAVIKIKLHIDPDNLESRAIKAQDTALFRYAVLNIAHEILDQELACVSAYTPNDEIVVITQWNEQAYSDTRMSKLDHLEMIARSLLTAIKRYLQIDCLIGLSQIMKGVVHIPDLYEQASKAISWNRMHQDNQVFYYGDLNWSIYDEEPTADEMFAHNNSIVLKVRSYLDENFHQKGLTLNDVANRNHVSPNYLSYLYKKFTGYNLWEYVIKLRMEESKRLLETTDLRRYEIADRVGYESPEHFSKIFKKHFGSSPSEVKK